MTGSSAFAFLGLMDTSRYLRVLLLVLVSVSANRSTGVAAPLVDDAAKTRAAAFQKEAHVMFSRNGWRIDREQPGRIVAEHHIGFPLGAGHVMEGLLDTNVTGVARVTITFQPKTVTDTACVVNVQRFDYNETRSAGHYTLTGPSEMKAQSMLEEISEMVGKARGRLLAAHPEYAAR